MMTIIAKEKFLEEHGWQRYGSDSWVKKEWLEEPKTLNREPHLCPNWYHVESLDDAIALTKEELAIAKTKEECTIENMKTLERLILHAMRSPEWGDVRSAVRGFAKRKLYPWYVEECKNCNAKPNPDIAKDFGELGELA